MPTNPYIRQYDWRGTQSLYQDLTIEAIQFYGIDVVYIPRQLIASKTVFGEDPLSIFQRGIPIEMFPKMVDGFGGNIMFGKFGIEVRKTMTFSVAQKRFTQAMHPKILTEENRVIRPENSDNFDPNEVVGFIQESPLDYSYDHIVRPREGDLIFIPMTNNLMEIKQVDQEELFYQVGWTNTYELTCDAFEYSSERLQTGNQTVDEMQTTFSADILNQNLETETGDGLSNEAGGEIIEENVIIEKTDVEANNQIIGIQSSPILDWDEKNPFAQNLGDD